MKMIKWLLLAALITLTGCIDEKEEFTINPDGSGKIFYSINLKPMDLGALMGASSGSTPKVDIKDNLKKLLENSDGIDTWKDVSYKILEDGRAHIEATGYFPDINKVILDKSVQKSKKPEIIFKKTGDKITVEFVVATNQGPENKTAAPPALTDEQIDQQLKMMKMGYQQSKMMMGSFLKDMKFDTSAHLPGKISKSTNLTKVDDNTVQIATDGDKIIKAMDLMMADDAYLKEMIKKGQDPMQQPDQMKLNEAFFGEAAPVSVTVDKADKPLFDYKAEMEAAKAKFPAMKAKLYAELDELAKKQPKKNQNSELQKMMENMQQQAQAADVNDAAAKQEADVNSVPAAELLKKGIALERARKIEEAVEVYLSVAENPDAKDKDVAKARTYLARSYIKTKEFEKAKEQLETMIKDFSGNRAVVLRAKKQLQRVKKLLGEPTVTTENLEAMKEKLKTPR